MALPANQRACIRTMIRPWGAEGLLRKAGELHGYCYPFVVLGVSAGCLILAALGIVENLAS